MPPDEDKVRLCTAEIPVRVAIGAVLRRKRTSDVLWTCAMVSFGVRDDSAGIHAAAAAVTIAGSANGQ